MNNSDRMMTNITTTATRAPATLVPAMMATIAIKKHIYIFI